MSRFAFDAVLFDLDGTPVATERYWPDAARSATLEFFSERGIDRPAPSTADWMAMVGLPLESAFAAEFADLDPDVRTALMAACVKEEHALLARGSAALLPGVEDTLVQLKAAGVRLGVASNCSHDYLDVMMNGLGLARWIEEGRCLGMPGISNKADMITDLLATFGTRSAVMVGDRPGDRDAAWVNAVPHVHIPRGYGGVQDQIAAEAVLDGMDQLIPTLERRDAVLREVLERLGDARVVAVTGLPLAGKTLVARDLERLAKGAGREILIHDDRGESAKEIDARVRVEASEDALVLRAKGQRIGPAPVEELLDVRLPRARSEAADEPAPTVTIDATNPIVLGLR